VQSNSLNGRFNGNQMQGPGSILDDMTVEGLTGGWRYPS
jgi:hypothetical protein